MADWNSAQYLKFLSERTQPSVDLANRIKLEKPAKIIDIGCGPGNSTEVLFKKFPDADILGVDYSDDMLKKAKSRYPNMRFSKFNAQSENWNVGNDYDVVFSNACIQWVPDHYSLLPKMMGILRKNGVLAVQMPLQYEEPIQKIIAEVVSTDKWKQKLELKKSYNVLLDQEYFDILSGLSDDFCIWTTTYYHRLKNHNDIIEWFKSTGLKPYLDSLDDMEKEIFLKDILTEVSNYYKIQANGEIILRFPRLFFTATK